MTLDKAHLAAMRAAIRHGRFRLHSGDEAPWLYDALRDREMFPMFVRELAPRYPLVGIELGGAILAGSWDRLAGIVRKGPQPPYYYPPIPPAATVSLIDDVVTTEASFLAAASRLSNQGVSVGECLCILDRRSPYGRALEVRSLVTPEDLGEQIGV